MSDPAPDRTIGENGEPFGNRLRIQSLPPRRRGFYLRITTARVHRGQDGFVDVAVVRRTPAWPGTKGSEVTPAGQTRDDAGLRPVQGQKWAVNVGISNYRDSRSKGRVRRCDGPAFHDS